LEHLKLPDPLDTKWFSSIDEIIANNNTLEDPLSVWGVINGPFEPTWQMLSDGWPAFFILARKDRDLAEVLISKITDYCILAGQGMIQHGANAIRIGDDYALNEGIMVSPDLWHDLIYPQHKRLVEGLKAEGGEDFPVILHSDGNIMDILDWLGESGLDGINPIQPDALDFETVVKKIGKKLSITGAFDLRLFLEKPNQETKKKLSSEINRLFGIIEQFNQESTNTGFVIGPTHQIQPTSYVETFEMWVKLILDLRI
jgi:uroporphyrinogen decarboxylase